MVEPTAVVPAAGGRFGAHLSFRRSELADAIETGGLGLPARAKTLIGHVVNAHTVITLDVFRPAASPAQLWLDEDRTAVAIGHDPVIVHRIRTENTALALIALTGLQRDPGRISLDSARTRPPGRTGGTRPELDEADRWWRLEVVHAGSPGKMRLEVIDQHPHGLWIVDDAAGNTRLEPSDVTEVIRRLCEALPTPPG